jgi:WS/DGAT/MGAT family acyltransferase
MSTSIRKLSVIDSAFLFAETTECPMHVGSMTIVRLPDGYEGDFFEDLRGLFASRLHLAKSLTYKLAQAPFDIDRPSWVEDDDFNIDRHVFRAALPAPGDRATLQQLVGWLHAKPLNRARPLWEIYVFEGLPNNEAGIYSKMHHALIDGGAGAALTEILYDTSPTPRTVAPPAPSAAASRPQNQGARDIASSLMAAYAEMLRMPFVSAAERKTFELPRSGGSDLASVLLDATMHQIEWPMQLGANLPEIMQSLATAASSALRPEALKSLERLSAPPTPLNVAISSERSFAAVSLPLDRVKAVAAKAGGKVNDVVLALSGGMLRRYLLEIDALPKKTLTAFVPISARDQGNTELKNQVFGMVCPLATHLDDARARLEEIITQAANAKELANPFRALVPHFAEIPTFGTPMLFQLLATFYSRSNLANVLPPGVNVVVSNVFFSRKPFYVAAAELQHVYPMSIPAHGQALNITVHGYRDQLDFGLIAAANVLPHVEHLSAMLPTELEELERAYGLTAAAPTPAAAPPKRAARSRSKAKHGA